MRSRWFTRGWTLQELLAPKKVVFFDGRWRVLGDRKDLAGAISKVTRIHIGVLHDRKAVPEYSIAQRMSWAADRVTSRQEDIAYCLLGIFGINMPLLYGEGSKAFIRFQQEIIKISDDQSLLAWDFEGSSRQVTWNTILAPSPANYRYCGSIVRDNMIEAAPYSTTNRGIYIQALVVNVGAADTLFAGLNCAKQLYSSSDFHLRENNRLPVYRKFRVWIPLRRVAYQSYAKGHRPSSRIFLGQSYVFSIQPTLKDIFLALDGIKPQLTNHKETIPWFPGPHVSSESAGFLILAAAGDLSRDGQVFRSVYPLKELSIISLRSRGRLTLSHQLVSCQNITVVLSILWDAAGRPQEWRHSTIYDPSLRETKQMVLRQEWKCLFDDGASHPSSGCCNTSQGLYSLHEMLHQQYARGMFSFVKGETSPLVSCKSMPLLDSYCQPVMAFDIVFREKVGAPRH